MGGRQCGFSHNYSTSKRCYYQLAQIKERISVLRGYAQLLIGGVNLMSVDFGLIAWHEDGRWDAAQILTIRDIGAVMDSLKAQQTNGGAIALIAIEDEFVIIARSLGGSMQMMISDVTYAIDYEVAADLVEVLDLEFPEEDDESQPGGDLDLLNDLGVSEMELLSILDDIELYPDEQLEAIANRLGFGEQFNQVIESN
jgi:putative tRNA adenosine deaminase-associated protein